MLVDCFSVSGKPYILLSGDDEGTCYYLVPNSQSQNDWEYQLIRFMDEGPGQIVGQPTVVDADGDGFTELFIPSHQEDVVKVFTFNE